MSDTFYYDYLEQRGRDSAPLWFVSTFLVDNEGVSYNMNRTYRASNETSAVNKAISVAFAEAAHHNTHLVSLYVGTPRCERTDTDGFEVECEGRLR